MVQIIIEENYSGNNRISTILDGITSVLKKKRLSSEIYKSFDEIKGTPRIVILICASLKWTTDAIKELNAHGVHPLVFGFQFLDTIYKYSCINLTYTKSTYMLTGYLLSENRAKTAVIGYNSDSLPDRLKLVGAKHAAEFYSVPIEVFRNNGDVTACINEFISKCDDVQNIVCLNDIFAVLLRTFYPEVIKGKKLCSCSGMKIASFMDSPHPTSFINYFKAGECIANLYLFLMRCDEIYSTAMTLEMDIFAGADFKGEFPLEDSTYSQSGVDFYGDKSVMEIEQLDHSLLMLDEYDELILHDIMQGNSYETIAEKRHMAPNTVKYRVHAMAKNAGVPGRKELVALIEKYNLKL